MINRTRLIACMIASLATVSALAAQSASAADHLFVCTAASCENTVGQDESHELILGSAKLACTTATATGQQSTEEAESLALTPSLSGCKIGSTNVEVKNEGCEYLFTGNTTKSASNPTGEVETATVHTICPEGKAVKIVGPGCTIDIGSQTRHGVRYDNSGGSEPTDITLTTHLWNTEYNVTNAGCALLGLKVGLNSNGVYKGNGTLRAYKTGSGHGAGDQVGLHIATL